MNAPTHAGLADQIKTVLDAKEFLTGKWETKPAEVGFFYDNMDLAGYRKIDIIQMAHDVAKEIEARRQADCDHCIIKLVDDVASKIDAKRNAEGE